MSTRVIFATENVRWLLLLYYYSRAQNPCHPYVHFVMLCNAERDDGSAHILLPGMQMD